jgi:hypothetical protein
MKVNHQSNRGDCREILLFSDKAPLARFSRRTRGRNPGSPSPVNYSLYLCSLRVSSSELLQKIN